MADSIQEIFVSREYSCDAVYDGKDGLAYAESGIYDVIILDIMLPEINGFEILKALRSKHIRTPIILLTARDDVSDKVKGLDYGADDYMTKPFSTEELLARVRALSRRTGDVILDEISFGDITLDLNGYELKCKSKHIHLGHKEFEILKLLLTNTGKIFSKDEIITRVWGYLSEAEDNNVEVYISFIRKKLLFLNSKVTVSTIRKIGYHIEVKKEDEI